MCVIRVRANLRFHYGRVTIAEQTSNSVMVRAIESPSNKLLTTCHLLQFTQSPHLLWTCTVSLLISYPDQTAGFAIEQPALSKTESSTLLFYPILYWIVHCESILRIRLLMRSSTSPLQNLRPNNLKKKKKLTFCPQVLDWSEGCSCAVPAQRSCFSSGAQWLPLISEERYLA